ATVAPSAAVIPYACSNGLSNRPEIGCLCHCFVIVLRHLTPQGLSLSVPSDFLSEHAGVPSVGRVAGCAVLALPSGAYQAKDHRTHCYDDAFNASAREAGSWLVLQVSHSHRP